MISTLKRLDATNSCHFYFADNKKGTRPTWFLFYTDGGNWKLAVHGVFQQNGRNACEIPQVVVSI